MKHQIIFLITTMLLAAAPLMAQELTPQPGPPPQYEQEKGWSLSKLNPFRAKEPVRGVASLSDGPQEQRWKLPRPKMPQFNRPKMPQLPKPQLPNLQRNDPGPNPVTPQLNPAAPAMTAAPPASKPGFKPLQKLNEGARGFFSTAKNTISKPFQRKTPTTTERSSSGIGGFFKKRGTNEPPEDPTTTADFLKLPRPGR